jgi:hypothetical protein
MVSEHTEEVLVSLGVIIERVVHTTRKHPQVGWVHYEGHKRLVYIGFWLDDPIWTLLHHGSEEEYASAALRPMPIEDDPEYDGEDDPNTVVYGVTETKGPNS